MKPLFFILIFTTYQCLPMTAAGSIFDGQSPEVHSSGQIHKALLRQNFSTKQRNQKAEWTSALFAQSIPLFFAFLLKNKGHQIFSGAELIRPLFNKIYILHCSYLI